MRDTGGNAASRVLSGAFAIFAGIASAFPGRAAEPDTAQLNGVVVGTFQHADQSGVRDEWSTSTDIAGQIPLGPGLLGAEIKANTTPRNRGVTAALGEANDTVGETLNRHGNGRISVVQLYYSARLGPGRLTAGLLDATAILDSNAVASVEYTQFMGSTFVHNLAIEFPSFALGANYRWDLSETWRVEFLASSTAGLEDQPNPNYSHVLSPFSDDQGVFGAVELQGEIETVEGNLGGWVNGADHGRLSTGRGKETNYGIYTNLVGPIIRRENPDEAPKWSLRLGVARRSTSPARDLEAFAVAVPYRGTTFGIGIGRTGASPDLGNAHALLQAEAYWKFPLWERPGQQGFYVSPDVQYLRHSNFDPGIDHSWVLGVRVGYEFCFAAQACL